MAKKLLANRSERVGKDRADFRGFAGHINCQKCEWRREFWARRFRCPKVFSEHGIYRAAIDERIPVELSLTREVSVKPTARQAAFTHDLID